MPQESHDSTVTRPAGGTSVVAAPNFIQVNTDPHLSARTEVHSSLRQIYRENNPDKADLARFPVDKAHATWETVAPDYRPIFVDYPRGASRFAKSDDHPDTADASKIRSFQSHEVVEVKRESNGRPINPIGPTGLSGRGILDLWGPNHAADGVLTRHNPENGRLEVLLIGRGDASISAREHGERALPGGKVDPGETEAETARRELFEETGISGIEVYFPEDSRIYNGYVDDLRNTDNAWMETVGFRRHLNPDEAKAIVVPDGPQAGAWSADQPEVTIVEWIPVTEDLPDRMFGSHADLVLLATKNLPRQRSISPQPQQ